MVENQSDPKSKLAFSAVSANTRAMPLQQFLELPNFRTPDAEPFPKIPTFNFLKPIRVLLKTLFRGFLFYFSRILTRYRKEFDSSPIFPNPKSNFQVCNCATSNFLKPIRVLLKTLFLGFLFCFSRILTRYRKEFESSPIFQNPISKFAIVQLPIS